MATSFTLEHEFLEIPIDKFVAHLNDPRLNEMLEARLDFDERRLITRTENAEEIVWQFAIKKRGDLPKALQKFVPGDGLGWREESRLRRSENCIYWKIIPDTPALKFHGEGTWVLKPKKNGCTRTISGSVSVDIPFVGKMVEAFIVNELKKTYEIEPDIQREFYKTV